MGANGGESPFVVGDNNIIIKSSNNNNNVYKGISIADRRNGFDVSNLHPCSTTDVFTVSPGISPSALLDSPVDSPPVMLPNAQAQLSSPTTGSMIVFRCGNKVENSDQYLQDTVAIAKTEESKNSWECLAPVPNCKTNNRNNNPNQQKCWEDGFLWRKYGQKQVKGSEFPRSYYKCTSTNCEVTKKVERSLDGQISEIVYKGSHNHPPIRKNEMPDMNMNMNMNITTTAAAVDHHVDLTPTPTPIFDIHEQLDDRMSPQSISNEDDDHQHDPKRRKIRESLGAGPSTHERCGREPKVVLQVESEIDILEDGYRWRKYGQKVVKGNPNPRSYYKCTSPECFVRKHVERAADDIKSVVITYEGKHNHGVPSSRSSSSSSTTADKYPSTIRPQSLVHCLQDQRPLYLQERKPILNYNEFMTTPPIYPYPFPRTPFIMNTNFLINNYHSTTSNHISTHLDPNFHYIPPIQSSSNQPQEIIKEEPKDHDTHEVVYDDHTSLSLPDYAI